MYSIHIEIYNIFYALVRKRLMFITAHQIN